MSSPDEGVARASAARAFARGPEPHPAAEPGEPVLVRDMRGAPSYWAVPAIENGAITGIARVLVDGRLATIAWLQSPASDVPALLTGLDAAGARATAASLAAREPRARVSDPVLVHDGPVGREAWRIQIASDTDTRSAFATGGGVYER